MGDLLDAIVDNTATLYQLADDEDGSLHIAVVGKPNAGKSTLVNLLIGENRMIVSDIPGTTRDAIDSRIERGGVEYTFIDTAGLRRKSKIADEVERYSIIRAIAAVDRADVVLMMVDAQTGVTEQDSKIAGIAHNRFIPTIIVVNKWDLIKKDTKTMQKMTGAIRNSLAFMPYAPMLFISAKTGKRAEKIYDKIQYVVTQSRKRVLSLDRKSVV